MSRNPRKRSRWPKCARFPGLNANLPHCTCFTLLPVHPQSHLTKVMFGRSLGNGVRKNGVRNRCPYRRCGVDTEIPYRLPFWREFCLFLPVRMAFGVDTEFPYRVRIVDRGFDCRDPVCRHRFRLLDLAPDELSSVFETVLSETVCSPSPVLGREHLHMGKKRTIWHSFFVLCFLALGVHCLRVPQKECGKRSSITFFHFRDAFGHFSVTFSDASVTFFVTFLPDSFCRTPFAAGWLSPDFFFHDLGHTQTRRICHTFVLSPASIWELSPPKCLFFMANARDCQIVPALPLHREHLGIEKTAILVWASVLLNPSSATKSASTKSRERQKPRELHLSTQTLPHRLLKYFYHNWIRNGFAKFGKVKMGVSNGGLRPLSAICAQSSTIVHFCALLGPFVRGTFLTTRRQS